jgi:hypothetical protein
VLVMRGCTFSMRLLRIRSRFRMLVSGLMVVERWLWEEKSKVVFSYDWDAC